MYGNQLKNFVSKSNFLTLRFYSDSSVVDNGFSVGISERLLLLLLLLSVLLL